MKRYILLLALVCTLFFATGLNAYAGYGVGDSIEGIKITGVAYLWDESFSYYLVTDKQVYLFNNDDTYFSVIGDSCTIFYTDKYVCGTIASDNTVSLSGYGRNGGYFSQRVSLSSLVASNFDIYDNSGNKVFPLPPVPDPTPAPEVPTTLMEAIRVGAADLVLWIVKIIATIFLGGILLVIWKPLFLMSKRLLQILFHR